MLSTFLVSFISSARNPKDSVLLLTTRFLFLSSKVYRKYSPGFRWLILKFPFVSVLVKYGAGCWKMLKVSFLGWSATVASFGIVPARMLWTLPVICRESISVPVL